MASSLEKMPTTSVRRFSFSLIGSLRHPIGFSNLNLSTKAL